MLNPSFPRAVGDDDYRLPSDTVAIALHTNQSFDTGPELRLQPVYGNELWRKLDQLDFRHFDWHNKNVLDVCCGTGFLSYHLLSRITPRSLTLLDISSNELLAAADLLEPFRRQTHISLLCDDIISSHVPDNSFDVILGNSYLHHFYDLPLALTKLRSLLTPNGILVTLHEPTAAAVALESGSLPLLARSICSGASYIENMRHKGPGVAQGGGADVWLFKATELAQLLTAAGFDAIHMQPWHLLRPFVVALFSMHLSHNKPLLNTFERYLLQSSIQIDSLLRSLLPSACFGSLCFRARKSGDAKP